MGFLRGSYGVSMGQLWGLYGASMDLYRVPMGQPWGLCGAALGSIWGSHGAAMGFAGPHLVSAVEVLEVFGFGAQEGQRRVGAGQRREVLLGGAASTERHRRRVTSSPVTSSVRDTGGV